MAFEGLKESLKERWADTWSKVQESSAFNNAREQFEAQTPTIQRAIIFGGIALAILLLLSAPYGYLASSSDNMAAFEENRSLIQGLLRASRSAKEAPPLPPPMDPGSLRQLVERTLHEKKLAPEQFGDMQAIPGTPSKLAPKLVVQNGIAAQIKQLNLTQIIDIATTFQNLGVGIKLIGFDIVQTAGQSHYYDMIVRVVNFGLAPVMSDVVDEKPSASGRPKRGSGGGGAGNAAPGGNTNIPAGGGASDRPGRSGEGEE